MDKKELATLVLGRIVHNYQAESLTLVSSFLLGLFFGTKLFVLSLGESGRDVRVGTELACGSLLLLIASTIFVVVGIEKIQVKDAAGK